MWLPNLPITIISATAATIGGLCLFKDYHSGPPFDKSKRADNLTVVVTGATSGIGRETTRDFAKRGAKVFMACRDMAKCEEARRDIVLETENKYVYCRPCDLASTQSIREFVTRFKSEEPYCHVLVNNAGVMEPPQRLTRDGFEAQFGVNHLGHFLLTNLMMDTLKASAPSRVVIVSSSSHRSGTINKEDLNLTQKYNAAAAYNQSKLANVLFARELARRTMESGIVVACVDPGLTDTLISQHTPMMNSLSRYFIYPVFWPFYESGIVVACVDPGLTDTLISRHTPMMNSLSRYFIYPVFWPFMKSPIMGAQAVLHAALDEQVGKESVGDYYVDMKKTEPSKEAQDYELGMWLWLVSEKWTKVAEHKDLLTKAVAA